MDQASYIDGRRGELSDISDTLGELRAAERGFLWIGLLDPTLAELAEMNAELGLHHLAMEDLARGDQRPKLEHYDGGVLLSLKTLRILPGPGGPLDQQVETGELLVYAGDRFVLTVRRRGADPLGGVRALLEESPERLALGPVAVIHAVLDWAVDAYRDVTEVLDDAVTQTEEAVFDPVGPVDGGAIYRLKREVLEARQASTPLVPVLRRLLRPEAGDARLVDKKLAPYFRDVDDHLTLVVDRIEGYERQLSDILSAHLSRVSVQQNEDMRRISAWVAIAAVPTMIAGIYGMNFEHMPELAQPWGYPLVLGVMAVACISLFIVFKRHRWF